MTACDRGQVGLHHDFSNGDPLSRKEIQVFSVLDLPACLGQLLIDTHTRTRLRGKKAGTVRITHGAANVTDTDPSLSGIRRLPASRAATQQQGSALQPMA
jgi:hypothetical protein